MYLKIKTKYLLILIHSIFPIFLGSFIYIFFRSNQVIMNTYIEKIVDIKKVSTIVLPNWVLYNLPDGLWAYSLMSSFLLFLNFKKDKKYYILIVFLFPIIIELCQWLKIQKGTFDVVDIIYYLLFSTLSLLFLKNYYLT